jgi:hypothetical protein
MSWVPTWGWLSKVAIHAAAPQLGFDLAIDATGAGAPSRLMAGLDLPGATPVADRTAEFLRIALGAGLTIVGVGGLLVLVRRRPPLRMA